MDVIKVVWAAAGDLRRGGPGTFEPCTSLRPTPSPLVKNMSMEFEGVTLSAHRRPALRSVCL